MTDPRSRDDPSGLIDAARALHRAGRRAEAARLYHDAVKIRPDCADALAGLAGLSQAAGRPGQALALARAALAAEAGHVLAHCLASTALKALGRPEEALAHDRLAVRLAPDQVMPHYNLGNTLQALLAFGEAAAAYAQALALESAATPDISWPDIHWNRALALLRAGRWREGWPEFEWRFRRPGAPLHYRHVPEWRGESFAGRRLVIYPEQGLGDVINFLRYVPEVVARGGEVVLECPAELHPVLPDWGLRLRVVGRNGADVPFDLQVALPSLPGIFGTTPQTVPAAIPYLKVPSGDMPAAAGGGIGLVWAGSPNHPGDAARSCPLDAFAPVLDKAAGRLFSLQKGARAADLARLEPGRVSDLSPWLDDFGATARCLQALDLVITVDTAVAHLAGALGRPVWILLPYLPDWRWLAQGEDTPWYPSARLFRQPRPGDWASVMERVATEL